MTATCPNWPSGTVTTFKWLCISNDLVQAESKSKQRPKRPITTAIVRCNKLRPMRSQPVDRILFTKSSLRKFGVQTDMSKNSKQPAFFSARDSRGKLQTEQRTQKQSRLCIHKSSGPQRKQFCSTEFWSKRKYFLEKLFWERACRWISLGMAAKKIVRFPRRICLFRKRFFGILFDR